MPSAPTVNWELKIALFFGKLLQSALNKARTCGGGIWNIPRALLAYRNAEVQPRQSHEDEISNTQHPSPKKRREIARQFTEGIVSGQAPSGPP